jgi:hypothetical protein
VKLILAFLLATGISGVLYADLDRARAENNLERRSRIALDHAENALKGARKAYETGDFKRSQTLLSETLEAVELAYVSLEDTGKDPRRRPKHFKHAEKETRNLLKRIEAFEFEMSVEDRDMIQDLKNRTTEINEELLVGILGGKR